MLRTLCDDTLAICQTKIMNIYSKAINRMFNEED